MKEAQIALGFFMELWGLEPPGNFLEIEAEMRFL